MKRVISSLLHDKKLNKQHNAKRRNYPRKAEEYTLLEECGNGATGSVWRAICVPFKEQVAVKKINLETVQAEVETFVSETQMMSQLHHPNLLPLHCSFLHKQNLWMVMPFVSGGSLQQILKHKFPTGLSEACCCAILHETLKGLLYLHKHGIIHRDIKAGNVLMGQDGSVWLADFGIAATTQRTSSWGKGGAQRNTFAGSICWMAPEVIASEEYDEHADIWSLGITALEFAYGLPPHATMAPMKIMMTVMRDDPPELEDKPDEGKVYSKLFKDFVAKCLQKEPGQRASCEQLLQHRWFKHAAGKEFVKAELLDAVPGEEQVAKQELGQLQQSLEEAAQAEANNISTWNFNLTCLKQNLPQQSPTSPIGTSLSDDDETAGTGFAAPDAKPASDAVQMHGSPMLLRRPSSMSGVSMASSSDALSSVYGGVVHSPSNMSPEWDIPENLLPLPPRQSAPHTMQTSKSSLPPTGSPHVLASRLPPTQSLMNLRIPQGGEGMVLNGNAMSGTPKGPKPKLTRAASDGGNRTMLQSSQVALVAERRRQAAEAYRLQQQQAAAAQQRGRFKVYEEGHSRTRSGPPPHKPGFRTDTRYADDYHESLMRESARLNKAAMRVSQNGQSVDRAVAKRGGSSPVHNIVIQGTNL